ncbi:MAG: hypothetical protein GY768_30825, partial [Planctomycetaceae bacterium]|nr:hypothetical protein [Planctomycetaceae bacterium]
WRSPYIQNVHTKLRDECLRHGEFQHIAMDATIRVLRRVRGQEDYRSPSHVRAQAAIPEEQSKRRILTLIGRTGACLGLPLIRDESQPEIAKALEATWGPEQRAQVLTAASDQPSEALFHGLREVLPNLRILSLDPVHLPITYETAYFRKKTDGSRDLRRLMAKFNKHPNSAAGAAWGVAYTGTQAVPQSAHEQNLREKSMNNTMPDTVARKVLADVDPNVA